MGDDELAAQWKRADGQTGDDHPAGDIRLRDRLYGVRAAALAGVAAAIAVGTITGTIPTVSGGTTTTGGGTLTILTTHG